LVQTIRYLSDGKEIEALVCRPDDGERHPLLLRNHGGFRGLANERKDGLCQGLAQRGYVVAGSSYRGEDSSQGDIEVCLGEVTDVQRLLASLRTKPWVDPQRVVAVGGSHGGCVTLELAVREPSLRAAVDFFGVGDWGALDRHWRAQLEGQAPCEHDMNLCRSSRRELLGVLEGAAGGNADERAEAFRARSPVFRLGPVQVPLLFFHGTDDWVVPLEQTCQKRTALEAVGNSVATWRLNAQLKPVTGAPCGGPLQGGPLPAKWNNIPRALVVYEGQGHGFSQNVAVHAWETSLTFLHDHL
jgi:dipeptidyl aminopeptidase/acylaminoacyl peptidase